ncbi:MAG: double-strand break repair helicase AddA [Gluconobacter potus]|uniref:DNA 3'-5' helicase n=1 Tax=Gluconobacter potus TaxID=2724927 RepID=A0ABR9YIL8_9PROT|nr:MULTISPECIES: double-strand break repair helicase AddA [Gluconobacter]MBF0863594.1 double-strand break repair helicase AddA [Gluconobacter sp. R71656]MBF0866401.1 double-strand break repair helicase AddA [Gluconobacter sp. R75628]MBF0872471.1 double-strand break repair helicase AddA [Gluconobacter sp. R75629]MBF0881437.1 double-strand break repair helicase AddA [Gluconobacter potus]
MNDMPPVTRPVTRDEVIAAADRTQRQASDPRASVFVSASAGSGKTKLLIDRLLRLMLPLYVQTDDGNTILADGAHPSRILCLTYTKAAAAEMANRLQQKLGSWVSLPDAKLGAELESLDVPNTDETRRRARALFLCVLDLPGGLRIETIHAFCQSLLRRFPLEASVDPHFTLMEDTDTTLALREAMEDGLARSPELAADVAGTVGLDRFFQRIRTLNMEESRARPLLERWATLPDSVVSAYRKALKAGQQSLEDLESLACQPSKEDDLRAGLRDVLGSVTASGRVFVEQMLAWLGTEPDERVPAVWAKCLLTDKGTVRQMNRIVAKKAQEAVPGIVPLLEDEAQRLLDLQANLKSARLVLLNRALLGLAAPMLTAFQDGKSARGLVDYNDLIQETRNLLRDPGAAWVLYKLDGGIDHLLLDEVQDNSGLQWEIAGALTSEFFAGEGAWDMGPRPRTIFAVGDYKQSIYGFQGAQPEEFHRWRHEFASRVRNAGLLWRDPELNVSFRSVPPVLSFVDAVFSQPLAAHGLLQDDEKTLRPHVSARPGQGGRVELWPLVPVVQGEDDDEGLTPWRAPSANTGQRSAPQRLAEALAEWIDQQIGRPPQPGQAPLTAGDVLILVPRRSPFLRSLIRALKSRNVPVATLVRVGLTQQVAVRDLMTLCAALLLPQDDLTLASVLTSPLGGLTDDSLMALATRNGTTHALGPKGQPLWTVLRERHREREDWRAAWEMLSTLYARVDYASPYRLLAETLGQHGGRTRLLRRLGPEAAEPVDELLTAALRYEGLHPPSLQGFLHWLEASEITSKREAESELGAVRVMTVHGSKGLQARLVVMPDTTSKPPPGSDFLWEEAGALELPLWVPKKDMGTDVTTALSERDAEKARAENNRLLYVALTRASDWLVICGAGAKREPADTSWYQQCEAGFRQLANARSEPMDLGWEGERLVLEEARTLAPVVFQPGSAEPPCATLPDWMGRAPDWTPVITPHEDAMTRPLAPSRPDGAEFGELPAARSPLELLAGRPTPVREQAMRRGTMIHRLLQLLPETPAAEREAVARRWLSRRALGLTEAEIDRLAQQVLGVLSHPDLAPLFAPGSRAEQPISGVSAGRVVLGQVDRLRIGDGQIWVCDYKTNRNPPLRAGRTPVAYLRQMAAYRAVLAQLHPGYDIHCSLVWTEGPAVVTLPSSLLDQALPGV